jgi:YegS/Rv2252/BmrU family lipid kinase
MSSEVKQIKKAVKDLHRLQDKQTKSVRRVGKLRDELEKNSRKMQVLEHKTAQLEQRVYRLRNFHPLPSDAKGLRPARLIINTKSGGFDEQVQTPERLVAMLRAHGIAAEVYLKTSGKQVRKWTREAVKNGEELIIVVGGDGTIEDVALSLVGSDTALGIIPAGTMNNLARELGIPLDAKQACALIGAGITRQIDVGCIRTKDKDTYFLESAGLGLAIALPVGQAARKGRWSKLPSALQKLFAQKPGPVEVELDNGEKMTVNSQLVTVSNAPLYALNNLIAPDAKMDDGMLDVAVYDGMSSVEIAAHFQKTLKSERVDNNPNIRFYRTHKVHIRADRELPDVADKDELPAQEVLDFEVLPRAINVIVGQGTALTWPVDAVESVPPLTGKQPLPENEQQVEEAPVQNSGSAVSDDAIEMDAEQFQAAHSEPK